MSLSRYVKTPEAIEHMRTAGRMAAEVLEMIGPHVKAGVTTGELDALCHDYIVNEQKAIPACLGYRGFPKSICTSVNHVICHGIPGDKVLKTGDILNIDVTVIYKGYHGDTSKMFLIGKPSVQAERVCRVAQECLYLGIEQVRPGQTLNAIGQVIEQHAKAHRFSSVRDFCGHGIGTQFHEEGFQVLHYDAPRQAEFILEPGLTFTIEPMINVGKPHARILPDGWTAVTKDRKLSAQWEHTLLVTQTGVEVLTKRSEETCF